MATLLVALRTWTCDGSSKSEGEQGVKVLFIK